MKALALASSLFLALIAQANACTNEIAAAKQAESLLANRSAPRAQVRADVDALIAQSGVEVQGLRQCRAYLAQAYAAPELSMEGAKMLKKSDRSLLILIGYLTGKIF